MDDREYTLRLHSIACDLIRTAGLVDTQGEVVEAVAKVGVEAASELERETLRRLGVRRSGDSPDYLRLLKEVADEMFRAKHPWI